MSGLQQVLAGIDDFPTLPDVALRVCEALQAPDCELAQVAREVSLDAAMAGQLVRLANSAMFGSGARVDSVQRALQRLGLRATRNAVMTVTLMRAIPELPPPFTIRSFWTRALASAMVAWRIAQDVRYPDPEQAYLAGLVHDIGSAYLAIQYPEQVQDVVERWRESGADFADGLAKEFDCPVAHVSAAVLRRWNFPDAIAEAVERHQQAGAGEDQPLLAGIVLAADRLVRELGLGVEGASADPGAWLRDVPDFLERRLVESGGANLASYVEQLRREMAAIESFARSVFPEA